MHDAGSLHEYIDARLWTTTRTDAAAAALAARGEHPLDDIDAALTLRQPSRAAREASRSLGRSLVRTASRLWPGREPRLGDGRPPLQPVALGAVAALAGCGPREAALCTTHAAAASLSSAALRLLGLDPFSVAGVLADLRDAGGRGRRVRAGHRRAGRPAEPPPPPSPSWTPSSSAPSNLDSSGADMHGPHHTHHNEGADRRAGPRPGGAFRVGIGGPVGTGKTALVAALCGLLADDLRIGVVTNDIYTTEDADTLRRRGVLPAERIAAVQTGCCPHTAIRDDITANLDAIEDLEEREGPIDLLLLESGGDNLTLTFSTGLIDVQLFVLDVAGGDKVPRKGGPGVTRSDLLVINKTDLAPLVGADLDVMARDSAAQRGDLPVRFISLVEPSGAEPVAAWILHELAPGVPTRAPTPCA